MTLAGCSVRKMPLQIPQEPIITEKKKKKNGGGVSTPAPLAVPDQDATVRTNPITGEFERAWRRGSKYEPVQNEESCALLDALVEGGAYYETRRSARWTRDLCDDAAVGADDVRRRRWLPRTARISTWPRSTLTVIEVSIPQACHLSRAPPTTLRPSEPSHRCPRTWWYAIRPSVLRSGLKPPQTGLVSDGGSLEWVPSTPATLGAAGLVLGQRCRPL